MLGREGVTRAALAWGSKYEERILGIMRQDL